ncbi:NAD(P)/FAD-dependent oxidoreductase [Mucilaginibacter antarcticus]|uniref:Ferredoxin--NADP reductase n=1 Tax=Mucilaginibacter antarcticus TaxID=1855725 RepID=A0ABW5XUT9_9SPHI
MIKRDICIIGAGPVGLFAAFEAGLLKMRCHLIDALPQIGGQLSEIYPHKPIYDIPGYPEIKAMELVDKLMQQAAPFEPTFSLGERVESVEQLPDHSFLLVSNLGTIIHSRVVVIAGGLGSFEPRKPTISNLEKYEGKGVDYIIRDPEMLRDKRVVLAGGGDAALDWTIFLSSVAKVTLVHRGDTFRGLPDSADKVLELAMNKKINLILKSNILGIYGEDHLEGIALIGHDQLEQRIDADYLIPLFGLSPKLGPIADWALQIDQQAISVNTFDYSTSREGIYAIGDINTYPGKLKLILSGFHEAALMAQSAFKHVHPEQKLNFKYTTVHGVNSF